MVKGPSEENNCINSENDEKSQKFNRHLKDLNESIVTLKDDMKERSLQIFRDLKISHANPLTLEEKLDCEFLEKLMQIYNIMAPCMNIVLQND